MNDYLMRLINRSSQKAVECEVEEELRFHIEMRAREGERQGLTPEESRTKAALRFGDFARVKRQCVEISLRSSPTTRVMKIIFTVALLSGWSVKILSSDFHVAQLGNMLIAIAVLGWLFLRVKRSDTIFSEPQRKLMPLGLSDDVGLTPPSFDAKGRTPFERVKSDDD